MEHLNRTKIVATVGPASNSKEKLRELIIAGVNIFRLNFSHGDHAFHKSIVDNIRDLNREMDCFVGILADLQGPKLRIGIVEEGLIPLKTGDEIIISSNAVKLGNNERVSITYDRLAKDVEIGQRILVDDGRIELEVIETDGKADVKLKVIYGGLLKSNKGVNLPDTKITIPSLTEKDLKDLDFILEEDLNWVGLSFVRSERDIRELKDIIERREKFTKVIAKIEKPEALNQIDEIIAVCDGVMIARGDLAVEVPMEQIPLLQKEIIHKCIRQARPVIIATEMMESMITSSKPTRAELSDVANAVIDGGDALMTSGETAVGKYPVKVIETMYKIITAVEEKHTIYNKDLSPVKTSKTFLSDAICYNACRIATDVKAKGIIGMTRSGYTAFMVSSFRPRARIFIFTDHRHMLETLSLVWGVSSFYYKKFESTDNSMKEVQDYLLENGHVRHGDIVLNTASMPLAERGRTNMVKISVIH